ncbi:Aste57867_21151 [Aphanomyces stellatus]|uniref:Aste57867_21151 protein n=1 Tax=Aphanomyces stellatus TaxID=120398 RepID=A0A485LIW1_9STRA|nr:hypothetical protein As57867_021083 [Aphanomyces stellatus]VFT97825.1 Aste57867_21151 [Aphanomyces stellatus]
MRLPWVALALATTVHGCTDFLLNTTSNQVVSARTMDFFIDLASIVEIVPRQTLVQEPPVIDCPSCPDYGWRTIYGFVGLNTFGMNVAADGLNERGLSAAYLYLEGSQYPTPNTTDDTRPIVSSIVTYILGTFASVDDVKAGLAHVQLAQMNVATAGQNGFPLHVSIHDAQAKSLVLEFLDGRVKMYDNPRGVLTNAPPFEVQLALMAQHNNSADDETFSDGFTPIERFQRVSRLNRHADAHFQPNTSYSTASPDQAAVAAALHIINAVTIPTPYMEDGSATQYTLVRDHANRRLLFHSNENQVLKSVDFTQIEFGNLATRKALSVNYGDWHVDVTAAALRSTVHSRDLPPRSIVEAMMHGRGPPGSDVQFHEQKLELLSSAGSNSFWMGMVGGMMGAAVVVALATVHAHHRHRYDDEMMPLV